MHLPPRSSPSRAPARGASRALAAVRVPGERDDRLRDVLGERTAPIPRTAAPAAAGGARWRPWSPVATIESDEDCRREATPGQVHGVPERRQTGETVLVTDRGQVVAELNPPGGAHPAPVPSGIDARLVALAAEGRVRLPTASTEQLERVRRFRPLGLPDGTAQALLDAERGE